MGVRFNRAVVIDSSASVDDDIRSDCRPRLNYRSRHNLNTVTQFNIRGNDGGRVNHAIEVISGFAEPLIHGAARIRRTD